MLKEGLDVYELLIKVYVNFGGGRGKGLDNDLKVLVSGIYGYLGIVERNVSEKYVVLEFYVDGFVIKICSL